MIRIRPLALALVLTAALPAQTPPTTPAPQAKEAEPDLATLKAMKSKVFVIQHRDSFRLTLSLEALGSGAKGARMNWAKPEDGPNTITVRDFPENLAAIEEAIKRLDVPAATRKVPDVELNLHLLFASKGPSAAEGALPADLQEVVKQLKGTLAYRSYTLAASFVQRVSVNGDRTIHGGGQLEDGGLVPLAAKGASQLSLEWESDRGVALEPGEEAGSARYFLRKFQFWLREQRGSERATLAHLETSLNLKEGERVVVGTSVVKDRGLVVVLTARRVN